MAMKAYSTPPRAPELEPANQTEFSVIPRSFGGDLTMVYDIPGSTENQNWRSIEKCSIFRNFRLKIRLIIFENSYNDILTHAKG